jgi:hypothetical protein
MPPGLCLSPTILDQSFPRTKDELDRAVVCLGNIQGLAETRASYVLITTVLAAYHEAYDWQNSNSYALLNEIYRLVTQWLLQPTEYVRQVSTNEVTDFSQHPLPQGHAESGPVQSWRDETGKLFSLYRNHCQGRNCIGLACDYAFSEGQLGAYPEGSTTDRFPLVGPDQLLEMDDFDDWELPDGLQSIQISFNDAKKNLAVIGGEVAKRAEGSHYKVKFKGAPRSWVLDRNNDPIPDRFLDELEALSKFPAKVVRFALIYGSLPPRAIPF